MNARNQTFVVARNPDPESRLPYVVRIPASPALVLLAREAWPRTSSVYCHRATEWPPGASALEEIPIKSCVRRGRAIDLILDRGRENRSQIVFATKNGREMIFWQTARTTQRARPGLRIPSRRASAFRALPIIVDTRERYAFKFSDRQATVTKRKLAAGDYGVEHDGTVVAVVERKSLDDLAKSLIDGRIGFEMGELAAVPHAAVVVEERYSKVFSLERVKPGWIAELLARAQVRYPNVPIVFCETRKLAEEWTFRFLGAALAEAAGTQFEAEDDAARVAEETTPYPYEF